MLRRAMLSAPPELSASAWHSLIAGDQAVARSHRLFAPLLGDGGDGFVLGRAAASLDGLIATSTGASRWISGPEDRLHAHRLRALSDAVVVGAATVRACCPATRMASSRPSRLWRPCAQAGCAACWWKAAAAPSRAADEAWIVEADWLADRAPLAPLGEAFHARRLPLLSPQVGLVAAPMRGRRDHAQRLATALSLLRDDIYDGLLESPADFADLPARMPQLLAGSPCHVVNFARMPEIRISGTSINGDQHIGSGACAV